jgi:hypothetical protein
MCDSEAGLLCTRQSKALACPSSIFYRVQKVRESVFKKQALSTQIFLCSLWSINKISYFHGQKESFSKICKNMTSSAWKMQYSKTLSCLPWTCFLKNMHPEFWHFFQASNTVKKYLEKVYNFIFPVIIFNLHLWYMQTVHF